MKYFVFCVRDIKANAYGQPFFSVSKGAAIRSFGDEVGRADPANMLYKHPGDFELFFLGEFHDETGEFDCDRPSQVAVGSDYVVAAAKGE